MYTAAKLLHDVPKLLGLVLPVRGGASAGAEHAHKDVGGKDATAEDRWAKILAEEPGLFAGCDTSKVFVPPCISRSDFLLTGISAGARAIGLRPCRELG